MLATSCWGHLTLWHHVNTPLTNYDSILNEVRGGHFTVYSCLDTKMIETSVLTVSAYLGLYDFIKHNSVHNLNNTLFWHLRFHAISVWHCFLATVSNIRQKGAFGASIWSHVCWISFHGCEILMLPPGLCHKDTLGSWLWSTHDVSLQTSII